MIKKNHSERSQVQVKGHGILQITRFHSWFIKRSHFWVGFDHGWRVTKGHERSWEVEQETGVRRFGMSGHEACVMRGFNTKALLMRSRREGRQWVPAVLLSHFVFLFFFDSFSLLFFYFLFPCPVSWLEEMCILSVSTFQDPCSEAGITRDIYGLFS